MYGMMIAFHVKILVSAPVDSCGEENKLYVSWSQKLYSEQIVFHENDNITGKIMNLNKNC